MPKPLSLATHRAFLGDVTGKRVARLLDVLLDRRQLRALVLNHCAQTVVEGALDIGDIALQGADRGGAFFGARSVTRTANGNGGWGRRDQLALMQALRQAGLSPRKQVNPATDSWRDEVVRDA